MIQESTSFNFHTPDASPGFLLWLITNQWQRQQRAALKDFDLTHAQFVLMAGLAWLEQAQETVNQVDLAQHTGIDAMMTSDLLRKLERKGLVVRKPDPEDSRANAIALTSHGHARVMEAVKVVEHVDHNFFAVLEEDLPDFITLMVRLKSAGDIQQPDKNTILTSATPGN